MKRKPKKRAKNRRQRTREARESGGPASGAPLVAEAPANAADAPRDAPESRKGDRTVYDAFRDNVEALVVAIVLALIIRHFAVEAFEIPTGSMAPTLYGIHAWLECPNCSTEYNVALRSDSSTGRVNVDYHAATVFDGPCKNPKCPVDLHLVGSGGRIVCGACRTPFQAAPERIREASLMGEPHSYGNRLSMAMRCPICDFIYDTVIEESNRTGGHKILVTKFAYTMSEPHRWDVFVFGFDQWKNYIKRLIGLPGERIDIWDGDIYVNGLIERKPLHPYIQDSLWVKISDTDVPERGLLGHPPPWIELSPAHSGRATTASKNAEWDPVARRWSVNAAGDLVLLDYTRPVDNFLSYNLLGPPRLRGQPHGVEVGDRKVAFTMRAARANAGSPPPVAARDDLPARWIGAELRDRDFTFQVRLPLGSSDAHPAVLERVETDTGDAPVVVRAAHAEALRVTAPVSIPLDADTRVELENVDDRVAVRIDGTEVLALEYTSLPPGYPLGAPPPELEEAGRKPVSLSLIVSNARVLLSSIQVYRDIYYIPQTNHGAFTGIQLGEDQYLALGDNSASSSDGRYWGHVPEKNLMGKAFVVIWPAWPTNFQVQRIR